MPVHPTSSVTHSTPTSSKSFLFAQPQLIMLLAVNFFFSSFEIPLLGLVCANCYKFQLPFKTNKHFPGGTWNVYDCSRKFAAVVCDLICGLRSFSLPLSGMEKSQTSRILQGSLPYGTCFICFSFEEILPDTNHKQREVEGKLFATEIPSWLFVKKKKKILFVVSAILWRATNLYQLGYVLSGNNWIKSIEKK